MELICSGGGRVEIEDVEVLDYGGLVMRCRVGERIVWLPPADARWYRE